MKSGGVRLFSIEHGPRETFLSIYKKTAAVCLLILDKFSFKNSVKKLLPYSLHFTVKKLKSSSQICTILDMKTETFRIVRHN